VEGSCEHGIEPSSQIVGNSTVVQPLAYSEEELSSVELFRSSS
jgi:hypothetical protein